MIAEYIFFSSTKVAFSRRHNMLGNKTNLHKFKSTEIIQRMFSSHNRSKLEIIKKNFGKYPSMWKVKNIPLNNMCQRKKKKN